jgi:hypothetical protein
MSKSIVDDIIQKKISPYIIQEEITTLLPCLFYAVRSSASIEDGSFSSFA